MSPALDSTPAPQKPPRNKLRKLSKLRPGSTVSNSASPRHSSDSPRNSNSSTGQGQGQGQGQGGNRTPQSPRTTLPLPPDLSDSKWLEYIRQSGYLVPMEKSPRLESAKSPRLEITKSPRLECAKSPRLESTKSPRIECAKSPRLDGIRLQSPSNNSNNNDNVVPEFAHLALDVPAKSPRRSPEMHFPRSDSPTKPASSSPLRRHPKPPVIRIGQLEADDEAARADKASSVEPIADQYRALLESRSTEELRADAPPPPPPPRTRGEEGKQHDAETRQASVDAIRGAILRRRSPSQSNSPLPLPIPPPPPPPTTAPPPPPPTSAPPVLPTLTPEWEQPEGSPTSDGTLVAFEEDAIYFKPVSYSPEALSPILEDEAAADDPTAQNYQPSSSYTSFYNPTATGHGHSYSSSSTSTTSTSNSTSSSSSSPQSPQPPPPRPDVLSLQIAMDLLTRELSSAVRSNNNNNNNHNSNEGLSRAPAQQQQQQQQQQADVRSLQVWVMIEAYEKLRDQVLEMNVGMPVEEVRALMGMFNMWIRALYGVHERLGRDRLGIPGVGDVNLNVNVSEALQTEELD
ncbi:hypothetical protein VMCG_09582 [Cytospora schulzeri]|uniref:Uncharacterized protein n=1 Tax=Cytospora schulzeri TaxID=448051 RepID=A0A423VJ90_9PEZI|nr:hypothetical protein VMCG_09582 [Valsa malicola]